MSTIRLGIVLLTSAQLVAAAPAIDSVLMESKPDARIYFHPSTSPPPLPPNAIVRVAGKVGEDGVSARLSEICLEKSTNTAEACYCLGDLAENRLGSREQRIILARKEGREDAARALMKGLDLPGAIQLVKDLKNFKEAARRDCKLSFRMKPG